MSWFARDVVLCYGMCHDKRNNIWNSRIYTTLTTFVQICGKQRRNKGGSITKGSMERWKKGEDEKEMSLPVTLSIYDPAGNGHFVLLILLGNPILLGSSFVWKLFACFWNFLIFSSQEGKKQKRKPLLFFQTFVYIFGSLFFSRPRPFLPPLHKNRWCYIDR